MNGPCHIASQAPLELVLPWCGREISAKLRQRDISTRRGSARLSAHLAEAISDVTGYGDHIRRFVRSQHAPEPHCVLSQYVGGGRIRRLVSDQLTQLLVWNNGAQIVEKARQKSEHRLIALNVPAVNK
jgi:hypothetical protein